MVALAIIEAVIGAVISLENRSFIGAAITHKNTIVTIPMKFEDVLINS